MSTTLISITATLACGAMSQSDIDYTDSVGHPDFRNAEKPKTSKASIEKQKCAGKRRKHTTNEPGLTSNGKGKKGNKRGKRGKKDRLTPFLVSEIILNKNIMTVTELHALAQEQEQKEEGKTDLVEFILSRSPKNLGV